MLFIFLNFYVSISTIMTAYNEGLDAHLNEQFSSSLNVIHVFHSCSIISERGRNKSLRIEWIRGKFVDWDDDLGERETSTRRNVVQLAYF